MYSYNRALVLLFVPFTLSALPSGGTVTAGGAAVASSGVSAITVTTQADVNVINWTSFDLATGESITFSRTGANSTDKYHVFNKITGSATTISGGVYSGSNGVIYIVNPNGVIVGPEGTIVTGGIFLSGLQLSGSFLPDIDGTFTGSGTVVVSGNVTATGYDAIFLGYRIVIDATSTIVAQDTVGVGAGSTMLFKPLDAERIYVQTAGVVDTGTGIDHSGSISASSVMMKADGNIYSLAINQNGIIRATSSISTDGRIKLVADPKANLKGSVEMAGSISQAFTTAGNGPTVEIYGTTVALLDGASISVSGVSGGNVTVGTDLIYPTNNVYLDSGSTITSIGSTGNGGDVSLYGATSLLYLAATDVSSTAGNGGNITLTSGGYLGINGLGDLHSINGTGGTFTVNGPLIKVGGAGNDGGNFSPPDYLYIASDSIFTTPSLEGILETGNVVISAVDIDVETTDVTWASGNALRLIAQDQIDISKLLTMTGSNRSGQNVVTLFAPIIHINSSSTVGIHLTSGDISISASDSFQLQGSTDGQAIVQTDSGDIEIEFGNHFRMRGDGGEAKIEGSYVSIDSLSDGVGDISLLGGPCGTSKIVASELVQIGGNFAPNHMEIIAGSSGSSLVTGIFGGAVTSTTRGNLTLQGGGDGTGNIASISAASGVRKDVTLDLASLFVTAGAQGANNSAKIIDLSNDGVITITAARDIELNGGGLGTTGSVAEIIGKEVFIDAGEDVELRGGHGNSAHAAIYGYNGVTIDSVSHIIMTSGNAAHTHSRVEASMGDITFTAGGNISMDTGDSIHSDTLVTTGNGTVAITAGENITLSGDCTLPNLSYIYSDGQEGHVRLNAGGAINRQGNTSIDAMGSGEFTYLSGSYTNTTCPDIAVAAPVSASVIAPVLPSYYNYDGMYELFYRMNTFSVYDWYLFHSNDFWLKHTYISPN